MSPPGGHLKDEGSRLQVVAAGAVAGLVSRFIVAPLDVVKIRLQLQPYSLSDPLSPLRSAPAYRGTVATITHILRHEGLTALWKGNVPAEVLYVCYAGIQFATYRSTTILLRSASGSFSNDRPNTLPNDLSAPDSHHTSDPPSASESLSNNPSRSPRGLPDAAESFIAGATSGLAATALTYPLDLLRTRFAAQGRRPVYPSLRAALRLIRRDEGARGFFRGIGPTLAQIVPFMGLFFALYEGLRARIGHLDLPGGGGDAFAGVVAGALSKTAVFPLDLVRKRIQVQGPTRGSYVYSKDMPVYTSARRALPVIFRTEGLRGLYKGLPIALIKSAPASAVTVWTYERTLNLLMSYGSDAETPM